MDFERLFDFLETLNANNSKEWMDENRKEYESVKADYVKWLEDLDLKLSKIDEKYYSSSGKKAINRINNNLLYHPNKPTYKDHFGAGLDKRPKTGDFYIHLGIEEVFVAGGFYKPKPELLKSIREAIDYNGDEFKAIITSETFQEHFGGLMKDDDKLKTSPKGFSQDHKHIDLLRLKSFAAMKPFDRKDVLSSDFKDKVIETYTAMLPFRRYLNKAVTV
ncbi:DUF2461 domain-containing protein [Psychroflexus lacisalsi]|jgi:uncharacterized protein (TIGR02453 family)|uniref:DUF2461 domain-containing protein n=1 Tax=Psychroflexus lacisalsi TaxID=503928 RepID=A0ABP3VP90_9FLAO|nr:DUF2461 domain-containing protein [Psychroflexus lacisalsi]MBZ9620501.1 DUF2461 domain-containing protein [Psychroflexus lacisalsi]